MANQRGSIALTAAEIDDYLAAARTIVLATIGADGQPHLSAMWFAYDTGRLLMWTYGKSQKVRNIERDPRVTCLVEDGDTYGTLRGSSVTGRATVRSDAALVRRVWELNHAKYQGRSITADDEASFALQAPKRVVIDIEPLHVASWDHRKLPVPPSPPVT